MNGFHKCILKFSCSEMMTCLYSGKDIINPEDKESALLVLLGTNEPEMLKWCSQRRTLIHMLTFTGAHVNAQDQNGDTPLHMVLRTYKGDVELCEPLLQAGADMYIMNKDGERCCDYKNKQGIPVETAKLLDKYSPGLWHAVMKDDICAVRQLINLWCTTDITNNGKTLEELAFEKGTEDIITLVRKIKPSTKLAHAVLACDYMTAEGICKAAVRPNLEFKNLGDMGATPLFYAITQNNVNLVQLLIKHGARTDAWITLEDEEIPIIFAALNSRTEQEIIKSLIPPVNMAKQLHCLHYQGMNVLMYCIKNNVNATIVKHILQCGHSMLLAQRNQENCCAIDIAENLGRVDCKKAIEELVHTWCLESDGYHRKLLALHGYARLNEAEKDGIRICDVVHSMEMSSPQAQFYMHLHQYQKQISDLMCACKSGSLEDVKGLVMYRKDAACCFHSCLADAFPVGDGQSVLHKSVLYGYVDIVKYLAEILVYQKSQSIDSVRDQWQRTALHYAYAHNDNHQLANVLLDAGASDSVMDLYGFSPHVMRDLRNRKDMKEFLEYHRTQDYSNEEPKPWLIPKLSLKMNAVLAGHSHQLPQRNSLNDVRTVSSCKIL